MTRAALEAADWGAPRNAGLRLASLVHCITHIRSPMGATNDPYHETEDLGATP